MTKDILEAIIRASNATSRDALRWTLNGVHVRAVTLGGIGASSSGEPNTKPNTEPTEPTTEPTVTAWEVQATDGVALVRTALQARRQALEWPLHDGAVGIGKAQGALVENGAFTIPLDAIPKLKAFLKAFPKTIGGGCPIKTLDMGGGVYRLEAMGESVEFRAIDGEFPSTAQLFVDPATRPFKVRLNPELLMNAYKAMQSNKRITGLTLSFDPESAMSSIGLSYESPDGESRGVLMPMRGAK